MKVYQRFFFILLALGLVAPYGWAQNPIVVFETSKGNFEIELLPDEAPVTVDNFLKYVDSGFYVDTIFHRIVRGSLIQGGGFTPELGMKSTLKPIAIEGNELRNERGTVAMARGTDPKSATAQFYINLRGNPEFDPRGKQQGYTVFGRVVAGMDVVNSISGVQTSRRGALNDIPIFPIIINNAHRKP